MPKVPDKQHGSAQQLADLRVFEIFGCEFSVSGQEARAAECPFCGGTKFHVNVESGQFKCFSVNKCDESGNSYTFVDKIHAKFLAETTDEDYQRLRQKRGFPPQTSKRHGLAWCAPLNCWLIPHRSAECKVQNILRYDPEAGTKFWLPGLPQRVYGLDQLGSDSARPLLVCEGALDAIALDQHLVGHKTRSRYDVIAAPSASTFSPPWLDYLRSRKVRLCFDADTAGRNGMERIAKLCRENKIECDLSILHWPDGTPDRTDIGDLVRDGVSVVEFLRQHCTKATTREQRIKFVRGDAIVSQPVRWMWPGHIPFETFVSLSGVRGTLKSTVARDLAARATAGLPWPQCEQGQEPFAVLYLTSEDSPSRVRDSVQLHGGDLSNLHVHDIADTGEPIDLLQCLPEFEGHIRALGARLVIVDALNSFIGGDGSTDSRARRTVSGPLQSLARRTGACVVGIRNWGRDGGGAQAGSDRALGPTSLSDVNRCLIYTAEHKPKKGDPKRWFSLEFERVSDARKPATIPFTVHDCSTGPENSHLRRIVWPGLRLADIERILGRKGSANA